LEELLRSFGQTEDIMVEVEEEVLELVLFV
jgi:hypothetical protein